MRDKICLFRKNISTNQISQKLDHKIIAAFKLIKKSDVSPKLQFF